MIKVSAVIPTRNRTESLRRCLKSMNEQTSLPDEVIIVDSSDTNLDSEKLRSEFNQLSILYLHSSPSVCKQRNDGIAAAKYNWILLCDDDIELPDNYLLSLKTFITENEQCGAVAGRLLQLEANRWVDQYPLKGALDATWRFVFQLSVWGDLNNVKFTLPFSLIRKWYAKRGNGTSLAGWPILTQWKHEVTTTTVYPLGASLVQKQWLMDSPFDLVLDPHGIGDNYGVAINFPYPQSIHVLSSTYAKHHRNQENRLTKALSYYRRVLALHYFLKRKENSAKRSFWFVWSLFGNLLYFLMKGEHEMGRATSAAIAKIMAGKNPYWTGYRSKLECVEPEF